MAWDASKPAGADKIKDSDDAIRANNDAIETVLGTNITAGPTTIQGAILGDGTKGRNLRASLLTIKNGTTGVSLKCEITNKWNGDAIGETDDIAKNATTGNFTLSADGTALTIEAAGLTGNALIVMSTISYNLSTVSIFVDSYVAANDLIFRLPLNATGAGQDMTTLVDTGQVNLLIFYITDA